MTSRRKLKRDSSVPTALLHEAKRGRKLEDSLAALGNRRYWYDHLIYFEQRALRSVERKKPFQKRSNYFAWLALATEFVCYLAKDLIFLVNEDPDSFDLPYSKIVDKLCGTVSCDEELQRNLEQIVCIRHIITHKGFPNPHSIPTQRETKIASDSTLNCMKAWNLVENIASPNGFCDIRYVVNASIGVLTELRKHHPKAILISDELQPA